MTDTPILYAPANWLVNSEPRPADGWSDPGRYAATSVGPGRLSILSSSFRRFGIYMFLAATGVVWTIPDFSSSQGRRAGDGTFG